ncbi:Uncharacterised protein [Burkholderia pseudomallei]|nr:Uncharacterised protein [Burkholderia pseudomallei]
MGSDVGAGRCRCSDLRACAGAMMRCETARRRDARCEMRDGEMRDARCEMRDARCEMRDGEMARWPGASGRLSRSRRSQGRGSCDCRADTSRSCRLRVVIAYPRKLATRRPADPQIRKSANPQIRKSANPQKSDSERFLPFCAPPFICNPKPVTRRVALPSTADCRLPTADCRLPTADCRLPTADCRPPTADREPSTAHRPPNAPARPHRDARNL